MNLSLAWTLVIAFLGLQNWNNILEAVDFFVNLLDLQGSLFLSMIQMILFSLFIETLFFITRGANQSTVSGCTLWNMKNKALNSKNMIGNILRENRSTTWSMSINTTKCPIIFVSRTGAADSFSMGKGIMFFAREDAWDVTLNKSFLAPPTASSSAWRDLSDLLGDLFLLTRLIWGCGVLLSSSDISSMISSLGEQDTLSVDEQLSVA